jgi:hypothetical protein
MHFISYIKITKTTPKPQFCLITYRRVGSKDDPSCMGLLKADPNLS